ncbi:hypothetical protein GUJ93_ZPchr0006g44444 [Zizania palustris]|uniref:Uncharacterized protein n=1 Tax=Zizania palustris TaxID=103762 RepID=A0A8J5SWH8_ZIZPA|nr:hypothetical protein GUJ93_ZPchr0006g44444 [Zizania palustris]
MSMVTTVIKSGASPHPALDPSLAGHQPTLRRKRTRSHATTSPPPQPPYANTMTTEPPEPAHFRLQLLDIIARPRGRQHGRLFSSSRRLPVPPRARRRACAVRPGMMARSETGGAASGVVDDVPIVVAPQWRLRRQRSVPAAVVAAFAQCGGGGGHQQHPQRSLRLGGKLSGYYQHDVRGDGGGEEQERQYFDPGGGSCYYASSAERPGGGVGLGLLRALWRRIVRGRRTRKVISRSGSSSVRVREQYRQDEYEQNFDEGAAAAEPEYLSRSFSARYAARRRSSGLSLWGVAH